MKINLGAGEQTDLNIRAKTVVYLAGAAELLFITAVGRFQIPAGGQVTLPSVFEKITIVNMSSFSTESELLFVEGEYQRLSDVSLVQIQGITNAITAHIATLPAVSISTMPAVEVSNEVNTRQITETLNIRQITEMLNIRPITETLKNRPDSGATFSVDEFVIDAGFSVSLSAKPLRKELLILAGDSNANDIVINGLAIEAGDSFTLDNFGGSLTITGAEGDSFKVCEVLYAN